MNVLPSQVVDDGQAVALPVTNWLTLRAGVPPVRKG